MRRDHAVVATTVAILLGVTAVSGPLVGVSLTEAEPFAPGSGTIDATVESAPATGTLEKASHGGGTHHLRAPPVELAITNVTGQPIAAYELTVPGLNRSTTNVAFLDDGAEGRYLLEFQPATIKSARIDEEEYDGTLRVVVTDDDGERLLTEVDVTIEVVE